MSEGTAESFLGPSAHLSIGPSPDGLPAEESMPAAESEDRRDQGMAGLAGTCCVCLEAEKLRSCLNSEKICIVPIVACLVSLCLCIAGLKWVFVDKIFEYDSPTHLVPGRRGPGLIIYTDSSTPSTWIPSAVHASHFPSSSTEAKFQITMQANHSLTPLESYVQPSPYNRILALTLLPSATPSLPSPTLEAEVSESTTASQQQSTETNLQTATKLSVSPPPIGTGHLIRCTESEKNYCVNGGECYILNGITSSSKYLCKCPNEFTGDRCQNYVMASFYKAEELYQKRVLTITGICIALLVVGIMCVVAYCKTKKQRKKLHDRLRQSLRSERNNMVNMANGPHHPNPPPENVQLVNQYVSKNIISSEHVIERETETSFSTSHYTSTTHHSTTVTQTPSHSWSNGQTESIISESHSVLVTSSVENSRHTSPAGPRGRLNGMGGPRECNSFLRHARDTPDSYRDSPHSERYVSAMTTPARMSPVDFQSLYSPKSPPSEMSPPVSSLTVSVPSMAVSPFIEEERPLLLVTPPRLRDKRYDFHNQQYNSYHHNPGHDSSSLPPSPLRIVEDEEYETTQEYEPSQEPAKKLVSSRRAKRTKPNGHISNRLEMDTDTSSESSSSESETEDERIGEDTPFLSIQNPLATSLESATAYRLSDNRTNPTSRFSTQEELQARLSSVIANQDPIAV
ncbi:pro-neuregulin-1, membrane-bound isoform isoform X2 [Rhinatrema bivittatum]|uniref:pro-neuregulin-1, membrane-bound isoform isoform X2 n=1 Tax=Rhinatrema bivittatum TaxID=194408 RepID=UPI001125F32C|nr:pro-neuregulin-1, membrane-bound isoform isoform X2 [Rhinatrema bivittatum]